MIRLLFLSLAPALPGIAAGQGARVVAFTFDDLPATRLTTVSDARAMTDRLLGRLRQHDIPAVGFVNEGKLDAVPGEEPERTALLASWLEQGHELGNHTYSHLRLYDAATEDFLADVVRGERRTQALMAARAKPLRYFRHPTLSTGRDAKVKEAVDRFLADRGYRIAPVTIDSDEYIYAAAYDRARARSDRVLMRRLGDDFVRYMEEMFDYYERLSATLLDREPSQVLLLHANWLNADYLPALAAMIRRRGYRFATLAEVLGDPAYDLPDRYIGARGPSWLERWAVTQGRTPERPPAVPEWVGRASRSQASALPGWPLPSAMVAFPSPSD